MFAKSIVLPVLAALPLLAVQTAPLNETPKETPSRPTREKCTS
jgi:hypothetical protein